jgi:hypothetical protein
MSVILKSGSSVDLATVTADKALSVAPTANPAKAGYVIAINPDGQAPEFGDDGRIRTGQEHLLLYDAFEAANPDARIWNATASSMTMGGFSNYFFLNGALSTTANGYCNLYSVRTVNNWTEFPLYLQWRARVVPMVNAVIEMGLGAAVATNVTCADGVFLRWTAGGVMQGVMSFAGVETTVGFTALNPSNFYNFELLIFEDRVVFDITGNDGVGDQRVELQIPTGQGGPNANTHMSVFARVYNTASVPAYAAQLVLSSCNLMQMDLAANRPWASQLVHAGRSTAAAPATAAQLVNYPNSAAAASATLSNTAAGYSTLGGLWQFAAVAGAATDYALFAYQVPVGLQLAVTDIRISAWNSGAAAAGTPTLLVWSVGVNSSAVSLATADSFALGTTGFTWGPRRLTLGVQSFPVAAPVGACATDLFEDFSTPLIVEGGRYLHVILRMPVATATASQVIAGSALLHGYFE